MKKKERNTIPNRNREAILEKKKRKSENKRPSYGLPLHSYTLPKYSEHDEFKFINNHTFANKALRRYLKGDYDFFYKNQFFIIPVKYNNEGLEEDLEIINTINEEE
jgi:hypothetical protein